MVTQKIRYFVAGLWALVWAVSPLWAAPANLKQVDMGTYRVISSASEKQITKWVQEFEELRLLAVELTGISDDQVLPLTIMLLESDEEFEALNFSSDIGMRKTLVVSVGLNQQPLTAVSLSGSRYDGSRDAKLRSSLILWMMNSSGLDYDTWVVQGMLDLFSAATFSASRVVVGAEVPVYEKMLRRAAREPSGRWFYLDQGKLDTGVAWAALHYLLLREGKWRGMEDLAIYQRMVRSGTPREVAFEKVFRMTSNQMSVVLKQYAKKGRYKSVKLSRGDGQQEIAVKVKAAEPGLWELGQSRLLVQQTKVQGARVMRLLNEAKALRPEDPGVYETLWLLKAKQQESGAAFEYLLEARKRGSRNHAIQLNWCIDMINQSIVKNKGFIMSPEWAKEGADDLMAMDGLIPGRMLVYRLHAQFVAALQEAREEDREFLLNAIKEVYGRDPVLEVGLAAWYWRAGQLDRAGFYLQRADYGSSDVEFIRFFGAWVKAQVEVTEVLDQIDLAQKEMEYEQVESLYRDLPRGYALSPELMERVDLTEVILRQYRALMNIAKRLDQGEVRSARILLDNMKEIKLEGRLPELEAELRARL